MVGKLDVARWNNMYSQLLELRVLKKPVEVKLAFTTQFLK